MHFVALNAGIIALVKPLTLGAQTTRFYLPVAVVSPAIFAAVLMVRKRLGRIEGAALTALYVAYVAAAITGFDLSSQRVCGTSESAARSSSFILATASLTQSLRIMY